MPQTHRRPQIQSFNDELAAQVRKYGIRPQILRSDSVTKTVTVTGNYANYLIIKDEAKKIGWTAVYEKN